MVHLIQEMKCLSCQKTVKLPGMSRQKRIQQKEKSAITEHAGGLTSCTTLTKPAAYKVVLGIGQNFINDYWFCKTNITN